jgi:hypothetical protein
MIKETGATSLEAIHSKPSILDRAKHSFGMSDCSVDTKSSAQFLT